jgi:hypothetical protein
MQCPYGADPGATFRRVVWLDAQSLELGAEFVELVIGADLGREPVKLLCHPQGLVTTARTYTHVVADEREIDYLQLFLRPGEVGIAKRIACNPAARSEMIASPPTAAKGGEMKRPLLVVAAALLIAASMAGAVVAAQPHHFKGTFSDSFVVPAGERCDFDERISFTLVFNDIVFGDVNDPRQVISHMKAFVSHTNLKTGYTLTERDNIVQILNFERGVGMTMGIIWKLRTPEGKLVFVQVGRVTYTLDGEVLTITPHLLPENAAPIVCGLLGGKAV